MTAKQMKDLLNNMSKKTGVNVQILQRNFMLERLLERISLSEYKDNFILKGGMLVAAMVGIDSRSTMDLDASIRNLTLSLENIQFIFQSIVSIDIGDDVIMKIKEVSEIREEFEYSCFRIALTAQNDTTVIPMKVDISTGDIITPREVSYKFDLLLENRTIEIWAYNLETVLAEKMETIISRDIANTRMRDFYDIYILEKTRSADINRNILKNAIERTADKRGTDIEYSTLERNLIYLFSNEGLKKLWKNYQKRFTYSKDIEWKQVKEVIVNLFVGINEIGVKEDGD